MKKLPLTIAAMLLVPMLLLGWLATTESGLNWAWRQAEFYLPVELSIEKIEGRLIGPLTLTGVEYRQDGVAIDAQQITVDWLATALLATNIDITRLHIRSLNIVLPETAEPAESQGTAAQQAVTLPDINLPWRLVLNNAEIVDLRIRRDGEVIALNKVKFDAKSLFNKINIKQLSIETDTISLALKGKLKPSGKYSHDLDIAWQFALPGKEVIKGHGQLAGNTQKTRLQQSLNGPLQLTLDATLYDLIDQLRWTARADIRQFDLTKLNAGWPALSGTATLSSSGDLSTATLTGNMQGQYPELGKLDADFDLQRLANTNIEIKRLQLLSPEQNTELNVDGLWMPGGNDGSDAAGGHVQLTLNWKNLRWPVKGAAWFDSANGSGTIDGNIDAYRITLDTDSPWPLTAPSTWHARASGNLDGMHIHQLRINALNGEAIASGKLDWKRQFNWQANASINNVDPAVRWPQWPGQLAGQLTSNGRIKNGMLTGETAISRVSGKLRGHPVSLNGKLAWQDDQLNISRLSYSAGKSSLQLNGRYGKTHNLDWSISSNDLSELYPETSGELQATGQLKGTTDAPLFEATFNGKSLGYPDIEIAAIDGKMAVELFRWRTVDIQLAARTLNLYNTRLLSADINTDNDDIKVRLVSSRATAQLVVNGHALNSEADATAGGVTGWHGNIMQADVDSEYFDSWQLDKPVPVAVEENALTLDKLCWHSNQQASICASASQYQSGWRSAIRMDRVPLTLFERWLPPELKLDGTADASADLEYQFPGTLLADADIALPAGTVYYPLLSGKNDQRDYSSAKVQLSLNAQGLDASSEMLMANGDSISGQLGLPGFKPLSAIDPAQPVKATAKVNAKDLTAIEVFIPEIYEIQGELTVRLTAGGTVGQPLFDGHADIVNGALQIPGLGLDIRQITFSGSSSASRKFNYRLDARSGDGELLITGHTLLDRDAGWPTRVSITGNDFEAANIPDAKLFITPELAIKLENRTIDIRGKVHIPHAKLQPKDVTRAQSVSNDTILIGEDQATKDQWQITTAVRLTLGERVHIYGFGFEGRLGGSLLLEDEPGQLTRATGEITVPEGIYRAYGQRLEVENGRILYTGGPLTNPGLDVRAVRKVGNVTAGIHVKGSLSQPRLEVFSSPTMSQTDALAYILLGGPIENASNEDGKMMAKAALALGLSSGDTIARSLADKFGLDDMRIESSDNGDQAALVVGRYLSPRIYVSYGVGLVERIDTITLRYQVSNKWQLKIESGNYQGADLLYTIER